MEKRRSPTRKRVLLSGLIVYGHGSFTCDCKFRNLSASGARLILAHPVPLPSRFDLINVTKGVAHSARLIWNKGLEMGVKFETTMPLTVKPDVAFDRLKRLWLARRSAKGI